MTSLKSALSKDVIEVGQQFYIRASSSLADDRTRESDGSDLVVAEPGKHRSERHIHRYGYARSIGHGIVQRRQHRSCERRCGHKRAGDVHDEHSRCRQSHNQHHIHADVGHAEYGDTDEHPRRGQYGRGA